MAAKSFSPVLLGIIFFFTGFILHAQVKPELRGFDKKVFEYHFDKADREQDPVSWMEEARRGLERARAGWERTALELYTDPELRLEAGNEFVRWSEEELEKRYTLWLLKRFFGAEKASQGAHVLNEIMDKANRAYAYHTGNEGEILYGETGDPQTIRPVEGRSVEEDREAWKNILVRTEENELYSYEYSLFSAFPELLAYGDLVQFHELLVHTAGQSLLNRRAEFEALLAREERLFTARRTGDIWSLRKQSENESASVISSRLILETENLCSAGIASLQERIEAAKSGTGDLVLAGEEWLEIFQQQFDRGLKAWAGAEERFIVRRMEWERDSGERFREGEEAWKNAFAELEKERFLWEEKARELLVAGEQLFSGASEKLSLAIAGAREEFQKDAALRSYNGSERARAWVDMYVTSGSILAEARESVTFWLTRFVSGVPDNALENGVLANWVQQKMNQPLSENQKSAGQELIRWAAIFTQYREKARESITVLERESGLALGMDSGALNAVLGSDSENFFLDEYQIELLRAKAVAGYWKRRLDIAEAVWAYADDLSAGRMTEAESLAAWRESKTRYDDALASYETLQQKLKTAGENLIPVQNELRKAAAILAAEEKKLDELTNHYALQVAAYRVNSGTFILEEFSSRYALLLAETKKRIEDTSYYTAYLGAELKYAEEIALRDSWDLLKNIIQSDTDEETKKRQLALLGAASAADWYVSAVGKDRNEETLLALENEGLFCRLKREAAEEAAPGAAAQRLALYRELFPYAPGLQEEAAQYAWRSLRDICAEFGVETENARFPDLAVLSGSLLQYGSDNSLSPGLAAASFLAMIDSRIELLPMLLETELAAWKKSFIDYMAAKVLYLNIALPENAETVLEHYETCVRSALELIENGETPEELIKEITIYQYLLAFLASHEEHKISAGNGGEHWRVYITSPRFDPYVMNNRATINGAVPGNPEKQGTIAGALGWEEGILADTFDGAEEAAKKVNEAFILFLESGISGRQNNFILKAGMLLSSPNVPWQDMEEDYEHAIARELFLEENEKLQNKSALESSLGAEIARLGFEYNHLPPAGQAALDEIKNLSEELEKTRINHSKALEEYKLIAVLYADTGNIYEGLYSETKKNFDYLEETRNNHEKQDAIQRWAGTSYLNQSALLPEGLEYYKEPAEELVFVRERYSRAEIALSALQDLYGDGQSTRPYADETYMSLYREYQQSFSRMFLALKAKTEFAAEMEAEQINNMELYLSFSSQAASFIHPFMPLYYDTWDTPEFQTSSWMDFVYITESGQLGISHDSAFKLVQTTPEGAEKLAAYFRNHAFSGDGTKQLSDFEEALSAWSARMASCNLGNINTYQTWGLALDYLTRAIKEKNPDSLAAKSGYTLTEMGSDGRMELDGESLDSWLSGYRNGKLSNIQRDAWYSLTPRQQEDLEFLAILLLSGGGGKGSSGLTHVSELREMGWLYKEADYYVINIKFWFISITVYRWPYTLDHSGLNQVLGAAKNRRNAFSGSVQTGSRVFAQELAKASTGAAQYEKSCQNLAVLSKYRNEGVEWSDMEAALKLVKNINSADMENLKSHWEEMLLYRQTMGDSAVYSSVGSALDALYVWGKGIRDTLEIKFEKAYQEDEKSRTTNQEAYRKTFEAYIEGKCSLAELNNASIAAYGPEAPSIKNHLGNLGTAMISDLKSIHAEKAVYTQQYRELASCYADLIERAYTARFNAELSARETGWAEQQKDIDQKLHSWREAAGLILERGRQDWKDGFGSVEASYKKWEENFRERYTAIDAAWNAAYFESLKDKEQWVSKAVDAANNAFDNTMLELTGADAEAYSRKLDGFMPSSLPQGGIEEASAALKNVFGLTGIVNLKTAFASMSGSAAVLSVVRSGTSGLGTWDAGQVHAAAKEFAWNSTAGLADGKMILLAFKARETVEAAQKSLEMNLSQNNKRIDDTMNEQYTMSGGWKRRGNSYNKDIIVHSTLFKSAITDSVTVDAYRWFVMDHWELSTGLTDANLENMNYMGVEALIALARDEIQKKSESLFGAPEGKFVLWVGQAPLNSSDSGSGELGRLMREFYRWDAKQAAGIASMNAPFWDKPLWDSRGSWFSAPSIRSTVDMMNTVAAAIVGTVLSPFTAGGSFALALAINLTDDFVFNALDVAYGYKSWDEAGFAFGKKALVSTAASAGGVLFNGAGTAASSSQFVGLTARAVQNTDAFGEAAIKTLMTGVQTISTGTVTSAISALTYTNGTIGWSTDTFKSGIQNTLVNTAAAGSGAAATGMLNMGLEGFHGQYYADGTQLSSLIGGLAGQGVNFALGNDFTLSTFNLSAISKGTANVGLLELHLNRDGLNGMFGSGGVDISTKTLAAAIQGFETWKVNFNIWTSGSEDAKHYISQMRTLYSDDSTKETYESILAGWTKVFENERNDYTQTVRDPFTGIKNIILGKDALNDESRFGLNVIFSHEAFRNGIDDGIEGQQRETDRAVMGHISTALGLMQTYGGRSVNENMAIEADTFLKNYQTLVSGSSGDKQKMESLEKLLGILGNYDSSADYWKFTSNGDLLYDGSLNLYDESGNLLMEYTGGGSAASLAKILGIRETEAKQIMKQLDTRGINPIITSNTVKVKYFVQRDYINAVYTRYNGDMTLAIQEAKNNLYGSPIMGEAGKFAVKGEIFDAYEKFAQLWKNTMYGYADGTHFYSALWDKTKYNNAAISTAFQQIKDNWSYTDNNPMYSLVGNGKIIDPVGGPSWVTTKSAYPDETFHGSAIPGTDNEKIKIGLAIDIGTGRKNHLVYTTQFENVLVQNNTIGWHYANNQKAGYGYHLRTSTSDFNIIYGHMIESPVSARLAALIRESKSAGVYTLTLPSGFNIGRVGNTGNSRGEHLHYELRPKF